MYMRYALACKSVVPSESISFGWHLFVMVIRPVYLSLRRSSVNTSEKVENLGFPFPLPYNRQIEYHVLLCKSFFWGKFIYSQKKLAMFTFEDLNKGIPSVLKSKVKLSSLVRHSPLSLYLLYTVPSTMSVILEEQFGLFLNC